MSKEFGEVYIHSKSDDDGADIITNVYKQEWYRNFTARKFEFHTDYSKSKVPPSLLFFYCQQAAPEGGESILLDGRKLYEVLKETDRNTLHELCRPGSVIFGEDLILGSVFEKLPNGEVFIRFRYDNLIYFSVPVLNIMPKLQELFEELTITFRLETNQGYILKNGQWLHGRNSWKGERTGLRMMINSESPYGNVPLGFRV